MKAAFAGVVCAVALAASYPTASAAAQERTTTTTADSRPSALDKKITRRLKNDASLKRYDVRVSVERGVATLRGDVRTERQRQRAEQIARDSGAVRVDNRISVVHDATVGTTGRLERDDHSATSGISDGWITTTIKTKFMGDERTRESNIDVDTNGHIVTLTGRAVSAAARAKAVQIARDTDGVVRVVDKLRVEPHR
jgi:osmotically-inducible protein OsmY